MSGTFWSSKMFSSFVPQLKNANCLDPGFLLGAAPTGTSSQWDLVPVGAKGLGRTVNWRKCVVIKHLQGGHGGSIGHDPPPTSRSNRQVVQALMAPQSITPPPTGKEPIGVCILHSYSKVSPTIARNQVIAWCSSCAVVAVIALW